MVPKPAHSGCESWLQSVWAVGRHLSQYSSAVDAFAAPGTCKQLAPQITVICDGVDYTTLLYLDTQAACSGVPMCYLGRNHAAHCAQNCCPVSVHCTRGIPVPQSTPPAPRNSTRAAYPTMPPHAIDWFRGQGVAVERLKRAGGIRPAQTEMIPFRVEPCESMQNVGQFIPRPGGYETACAGLCWCVLPMLRSDAPK
jgi:hypothetical protein